VGSPVGSPWNYMVQGDYPAYGNNDDRAPTPGSALVSRTRAQFQERGLPVLVE
jgi:pyruvate-formate lyase